MILLTRKYRRCCVNILLIFCLTITLIAQSSRTQLSVGVVIPSIVCDANPKQSYALYLPSYISSGRKWPIIYVFDPGGRGPSAVETVRAAAEKYGYIVVASNNSHNGPLGAPTEAAQAMWQDTHMKLPIDQQRRYAAGLSGGARVATSVALACKDCMAGVIANAASFPGQSIPPPDMKFAYFAAFGNADFNFPEFFRLRKKFDDVHARYKMRIFTGVHGWAPPEVWLEALNWMDLQAMASGTLVKDEQRIQQSLSDDMARAEKMHADGDILETVREYQSIVRNFSKLTDVTQAQAQLAALLKEKAFKSAERNEEDVVAEQAQIVSDISEKIGQISSPGLDAAGMNDLRNRMSELKKKADAAPAGTKDAKMLVALRSRQELEAAAYEAGQSSLDLKKYDDALQYFEIAAAAARHPEYSQLQRARVYALKGNKKNAIATLKQAVELGLADATALDAEEFKGLRETPEFQSLVSQLKKQ